MQKEILEEHPDSDLRVYVVWFNILSGDSRSGWDECVMSDPRAIHLWDEKRLASQAFAGEVEGAAPPVWDAYLLYGPEVHGKTSRLGPSARATRSTALGKSSRRTSCRSWSEG